MRSKTKEKHLIEFFFDYELNKFYIVTMNKADGFPAKIVIDKNNSAELCECYYFAPPTSQ